MSPGWNEGAMTRRLLFTVTEAAEVLGVSPRHIWKMIAEADMDKRSRWKFGREIVDITPRTSARRTLRININAVVPEQERARA